MKYTTNYCSDNGLGSVMSALVGMTRKTVENSAEFALSLIQKGNYEDALIFLKNAIEGIEILTA